MPTHLAVTSTLGRHTDNPKSFTVTFLDSVFILFLIGHSLHLWSLFCCQKASETHVRFVDQRGGRRACRKMQVSAVKQTKLMETLQNQRQVPPLI